MIWRLRDRIIELGRKPCVMGILNVTPDSFSDGGSFLDRAAAVDRALAMEAEGADIIDIGGESTRPFSEPLAEIDELRRVIPVIEQLKPLLKIPLSIDTYKSGVARASLEAGAEIVNDVSGLTFDCDMASVVAAASAGAVLMHIRGRPAEMQRDTVYDDIVNEVMSSLEHSLGIADEAGIDREAVVLDPGFGFGKDVDGNLELLRRLGEFTSLGRPLLAGTSRKSFIGVLLDQDVDGRIFGTAATVAAAVLHGAAIVRVHDVRQMRDVAEVAAAIREGHRAPI